MSSSWNTIHLLTLFYARGACFSTRCLQLIIEGIYVNKILTFFVHLLTLLNKTKDWAAGATDQTTTNEACADDANSRFPLGTMGFSLNYAQLAYP